MPTAAAMRRSRCRKPSLPACGVSPRRRARSYQGRLSGMARPEFERAFGARAGEEGAALARRAPVDLRVEHAEGRSRQGAEGAAPLRGCSPRRIRPSASASSRRRGPAGARMSRPSPATAKAGTRCRTRARKSRRFCPARKPRQQIIDLCAGAGGKTLALAALMGNTGQLYAYDSDRMRLRPIFERLKRAGVRNVQVLPAGDGEALAKLDGRMDLVLIDAPCTGSGVWRRRPDAKWRLSPANARSAAGRAARGAR